MNLKNINELDFNSQITYVSSGLRANSQIIYNYMSRVGVVMALLIRKHNKNYGVCITASHNTCQDNGAKLIDYTGEILHDKWNQYVNKVLNAKTILDLQYIISWIIDQENINLLVPINSCLIIGKDTRSSGKDYIDNIRHGTKLLNVNIDYVGITTTPEMHNIVYYSNQNINYQFDRNRHIDCLINNFNIITKGKYEERNILIDCANGVSFYPINILKSKLINFNIEIINADLDDEQKLNNNCGSDYIQKELKLPENSKPYNHCVSFDGDADRIIYFCSDEFFVIDGDRMSCLIAKFFSNLLNKLKIKLTIGIVQTAYANGASTDYMKNKLNLPVYIANTGIKYLFDAAKQYDIGIYFESNGHGSVYFSDKFYELINDNKYVNNEHIRILKTIAVLFNQLVGDAVSNFLAIEAILIHDKISINDWKNMYSELYVCQSKVHINDRTIFKMSSNEIIVLKPHGLQNKLYDLISLYSHGTRAFVRLSNTENILRIYCESNELDNVVKLNNEIRLIINKYLK